MFVVLFVDWICVLLVMCGKLFLSVSSLFVVVCCSLFAVRCLFVACCLLFVVDCSCSLLFVGRHLLCVEYCPWFV